MMVTLYDIQWLGPDITYHQVQFLDFNDFDYDIMY
jgi:hypothetical protein